MKEVVAFYLTAPSSYAHGSQIDEAIQQIQKDLSRAGIVDQRFTSENFKATTSLTPGERYMVLFVSTGDPLPVNGILVGGEGLTLAYQLGREYFPQGLVLGVDNVEGYMEERFYSNYRVPSIIRNGDRFDFRLAILEQLEGWQKGVYQICFCPV